MTTVAFLGLGRMGLPMSVNLLKHGFVVRGFDPSIEASDALQAAGGIACVSPRDAARGAERLVTMLPNSGVVRNALLGDNGAVEGMPEGSVVIDMSSSEPFETRKLGYELAGHGLGLVDAPVSGGVKRAIEGTLSIMAGGDDRHISLARSLLQAMGKTVTTVGPLGAGHAVKSLNNYVSAAGLTALSEALVVAQRFGIDASTFVDVLNSSSGKNNSTETKAKPFILSGSFASGFSLALMSKDLNIASQLADELNLDVPGIAAMAERWRQARASLDDSADHTEIYRFLLENSDTATG